MSVTVNHGLGKVGKAVLSVWSDSKIEPGFNEVGELTEMSIVTRPVFPE